MTSMLAGLLLTIAANAAPVAVRLDTTATPSPDTANAQATAFPVVGTPASQLKVSYWLNLPKSGPPIKFGDGHVYILNFTAMWCGSCPGVYPIVTDIVKKYGAAKIRTVFVTAIWGLGEDHFSSLTKKEELAALPGYFARHELTAPVAIFDSLGDKKSLERSLWKTYTDDGKGAMNLPKVVVIDGSGIIRYVMTGWDADKTRTDLFDDIAKLVALEKGHN